LPAFLGGAMFRDNTAPMPYAETLSKNHNLREAKP
jgi:hypothetical protein